MKRNNGWLILLAVIGLFALIWMSGRFKEGFTGNTLPTLEDANSAKWEFANGHFTPSSGTPSPTMINIANWFKTNAPWPTTTTLNDIAGAISFPVSMAYNFIFKQNPQPFINFIQSMPSGGSVSDNVTKIVNFVNTTYSPSQPIDPNEFITAINKGQPPSPQVISDVNLYYWTYVYLFGKPDSSTTTNSIPNNTPPAPTPCTPFYRSIPGGSLETRCFTSS